MPTTPPRWPPASPSSKTPSAPFSPSTASAATAAIKTKSGFDINTRTALLQGGDQGIAVIPGDAANSPLLELVSHLEEPYMPPKKPRLPDAAIESIRSWIDLGAAYGDPLVKKPAGTKNLPMAVTDEDRDYWAYRPLAPPEIPTVTGPALNPNPIDRFIAKSHQQNGLTPAPPVSPAKLIRRASYDFTGLPPSPETVATFTDASPQQRAATLKSLTQNPSYGERWARHWLDIARFAESHGFEHDYDRPHAYHYRDFVIQALNSDMPYDQFIRWQIAGDELAPENPLAMKATGFLGAGVYPTQITLAEAERVRYDALDDMLGTVGSAMLATTIACARCHDHKFDPIPTRDYYQLLSAFTTTVRSDIDLKIPDPAFAEKLAAHGTRLVSLKNDRTSYETQTLTKNFAAWIRDHRDPATAAVAKSAWLLLEPTTLTSSGGTTFELQPDGSSLAGGKKPDIETYTFTANTQLTTIAALRIEALADPSMVKNGPGRAANGNFALSDLTLTVGKTKATLSDPRSTFDQANLGVANTIDADKNSCWAIDPQFGKNHAATFAVTGASDIPTGTPLTVTLEFNNNTAHSIGRLRISVSDRPAATLPLDAATDPLAAAAARVAAILAEHPARPPQPIVEELHTLHRQLDPHWQKLTATITAHQASLPKPKTEKVMVCAEGFKPMRHHTSSGKIPDFYPETHILNRGDTNKKIEVASLGFPQALTRTTATTPALAVRPEGAKSSFRRAAVAEWITDTDTGAGNLLARVIVNRLWQHHFGRGLVATPNDFGFQGQKPTHPGLLEWLAADLVEHRWSLNHTHGLIVTSQTYARGNSSNPTNTAADPDNLLWWKRTPRRLEAEAVRDAALHVSGTLDPAMFGPGTLDENMTRRSIYFLVKRSKLIPFLQAFDWPDSLNSLAQRSVTTTPTQALALLNSPQVRRMATAFATQLTKTDDPVTTAYTNAFSRPPTPAELSAANAYLNSNTDKQQALIDFAHSILSANEFIFIE